ncbi:MAG: DUF5685 family protein [Butyrivibrio sp.]|nr:DUF5685 family protein [Butyrivibrio sp.]
MFGYISINKPELKFREYDIYKSYYCGFCEVLKDNFGRSGQLTLSYDLTFMIMLLSDLYDKEPDATYSRCIVHPAHKHQVRKNEFTEYAAEMNILLAYYKALDDWSDDRDRLNFLFAGILKNKVKTISAKYKDKSSLMSTNLEKIHNCEKTNDQNLDKVSGYFGEIMASIFSPYEDIWTPALKQIGFFLGKFIYIMDAYDDIEKDIKAGSYNPLINIYNDKSVNFDDYCFQILTMMMSECSKAFEKLPLIENADILKNIIYSGVWVHAERIKAGRNNIKQNPG